MPLRRQPRDRDANDTDLRDGGAASVVDRIAGTDLQVLAQTISETGATGPDSLASAIGSPGHWTAEKRHRQRDAEPGLNNFPLDDEISSRVHLDATSQHAPN